MNSRWRDRAAREPGWDRAAPEARTAAPTDIAAGHAEAKLRFADLDVTLHASGAAFLPECASLIVSDLHLEKGSAARGFIPTLDTRDTLQRLGRIVALFRPRRVVCLGDSFQDARAGERMAQADRDGLLALCAQVETWVWVSGNHDPQTPPFCPGLKVDCLPIGGIAFRHQPEAGEIAPQVTGHFHPKARVATGAGHVTGRCFCVSERLIIMPAFGAYTGGLDCGDAAIRSLQPGPRKVFMLHKGKLWRVSDASGSSRATSP
jgi:hypothetical protein